MSATSPIYSMPEAVAIELDLRARLWSAAKQGSPARVAEDEWVDHVLARIDTPLRSIAGDVALRLDVGVAETADPLWQSDLDNFLYPIARRLPARVVSVWATKGRAPRSYVWVEAARPAPAPDWTPWPVRRALGAQDLRSAVNEATADAEQLPDGPVGLQVSFVIDAARPRAESLWKPAIDGLEPLLGKTNPHRHWDPLDGRIVRLGLHHGRDDDLHEHAVDRTTVWATPARTDWAELAWLETMSESERAAYWREHRARAARAWAAIPSAPRQARSRGRGSLPAGLAELDTVEQFETAIVDGAAIVNKSEAEAPKLHVRPHPCTGLELRHFVKTVIDGAKRNGRYFRVDDVAVARDHWPRLRDCAICEAIVAAE